MRAAFIMSLWIGSSCAYKCIYQRDKFPFGALTDATSVWAGRHTQSNYCEGRDTTHGCCVDFTDPKSRYMYPCRDGHGCIKPKAVCTPDITTGWATCDCERGPNPSC